MLGELKKSFRLLKYTYNFKSSIAGIIIFLVVGIPMVLVSWRGCFLGGMYLLIASYMPIQMLYSLLFGQMVAASPKKHFLEIHCVDVLMSSINMVVYTLVVLVIKEIHGDNGENMEALGTVIPFAMLVVTVSIYYGACYKYMMAGTILFAITYVIVYGLSLGEVSQRLVERFSLNYGSAYLIGMVLILIGSGISARMRRSLYKKPYSPLSMGSLRKALK